MTSFSGPAPETRAARLIRCHDCDLLQEIGSIPGSTGARCARCGASLFASKPDGFEHAFVLYLTALILFIIANAFPFLSMKVQGQATSSHLMSGAVDMWRGGMPEIAIAVILFVFVFPLGKILIGVAVVGPLAMGRSFPAAPAIYRLYSRLHPWAMMEIFMLGVLVAYTKLIALATVEVGPALISFVAAILVVIAADNAVDPHDVWERLQRSAPLRLPGRSERRRLVGCHTCGLVCHLLDPAPAMEPDCPRCGSELHRRKPDSLARTSALLMTAAILYIPANLYPVMTFSSLGHGEPSTILGGVKELIAANMWPLATIVFVASILVPCLKLVSMSYLVISVRKGHRRRLRDRTLIYRMNEAVGRWSMVDVFVVSILVALVQLGSIASIVPGPGCIAFCGVVVLTMMAAMSFDARLMWDAAGANHEPQP